MNHDLGIVFHYIRTAHEEPQALMSPDSQMELREAFERLSERLVRLEQMATPAMSE